ncbi:phosphatase PAP2 family protein [Streptomyces sp. VRA16 Mangrove soil]|uniref:phosphatase PAP2 family protein n=1 Tax=Streptomyces sp. VRA16 Mangrove soil TaxID=2817434 RepID=UPI001A9FDF57|nr:phosphatase PAP2 family protein [Streptomyces sp. VRA16 Mangrove soil]MBO1330198.1 phosphatase PAP2 family protein [Streptomyces sp. VRA16 Mangrove soil]
MHPARPESPPRTTPPSPARRTPVLVLASSFVLLMVLVAVRWHPLTTLDQDIARSLHREAVAAPDVTHVNRILSDWVWDPWTMRALAAVVVVVLVWRLRNAVLAVWVGATCLVGTLLQQGFKAAVDRPRPVWPDPVDSAHYAAFPSGHAMTATVVCGLVLWLLRRHGAGPTVRRTALAVGVVSVLGVGLTRMWLGVHWPSDVLGGWLLGAFTVLLSTTAYEKWRTADSRS